MLPAGKLPLPPTFREAWVRAHGYPLPPSESPGQVRPQIPLAGDAEAVDPMRSLPREYFCESIIRQMGEGSVRGRNALYRSQKLFTWVGKNY